MDKHITKQQKITSITLIVLAGILLTFTIIGMSSPFNGVAMRAHVVSVPELQKLGAPSATHFKLPVYSDLPHGKSFRSMKPAFYLEPGDEVWVTGIMYDWYQIHRGNDYYWVYRRFIRTIPTEGSE